MSGDNTLKMNTQDPTEFAVKIHHNFDEKKFKWLWAKYVKEGNIEHHCTHCLKGSYSKIFSGSNNKDLLSQPILDMNEVSVSDYQAIYFCGVIKHGYPLNNYAHNVHFAVIPQKGATAHWELGEWKVEIENGVLSPIPDESDLDDQFFRGKYDAHFYTCRIFRWMVGFFYPEHLYSYWNLVRDQSEVDAGITLQLKADGIKAAIRETGERALGSMSVLDEISDTGDKITEKSTFLRDLQSGKDYAIEEFKEQLEAQWCQTYQFDCEDIDFDNTILPEASDEDWIDSIRYDALYTYPRYIHEGACNCLRSEYGIQLKME